MSGMLNAISGMVGRLVGPPRQGGVTSTLMQSYTPQTQPVAQVPRGLTGVPQQPAGQAATATAGPAEPTQAQAQAPQAAQAVSDDVGTLGADSTRKPTARRGRLSTLLSGVGDVIERFGD